VFVCAECEESIQEGHAVVERIDDPWDDDQRPELAWWCRRCAYVEFVTGTGPPRPRVPPPRVP
jgi:hypothetical protein